MSRFFSKKYSRSRSIVNLTNVSVSFDGNFSLHKINLEIKRGEFVYLLGESGAGKTTLFRTIFMEIKPEKGHLSFDTFNSLHLKKKDIPYLRRQIGMVFQDFMLLDDRSVFENIALPLEVSGYKKREIRKRVLRALANVGLSHKNTKSPIQLSGGEKQRIGIARAIVGNPLIVLADEPTGNLDPQTAEEILYVLQKINSRGTSVIMATHNYKLLEKLPARIIRLHQGRIVGS